MKIYLNRYIVILLFISCNKYSNDKKNNISYYMYVSDLDNTKCLYVNSKTYTYKIDNKIKSESINYLELKKLEKIFKSHKNKIYDFDRDSGIYFKIIRDSGSFKDSVYIKKFHVMDGYYNDLKSIDNNLFDIFLFTDTIRLR